MPAPIRSQVIKKDRAHRREQQGGPGRLVDPRDRQALRGGPRRGPGDHRHLRLLYRRRSAALRPDRAIRDARQAALHLQDAGRRRGDHHRRQLPRRRPFLVPDTGPPLRQRRGVEAGRVLPRRRRRPRQTLRRRWSPRRRPERRAGRRGRRLRGPRAGARRGARGQGRLHRVLGGGAQDRGALRPAPADPLPGARRQEPARRHARRRPRPRGRGRPLLGLRHRRPAVHLSGHRHRPRVGARRVPLEVRPRDRGGEGRRPDARRALRPDAQREVPGAFPRVARSDRRPPHRPRLQRDRKDHGRQPPRGLRR